MCVGGNNVADLLVDGESATQSGRMMLYHETSKCYGKPLATNGEHSSTVKRG